MTLMTDPPTRPLPAAEGRRRNHSGFVSDNWSLSGWDATPIITSGIKSAFRASMEPFTDTLDTIREHDRIRIVTTTDDHALVFVSVPRGMEQLTWIRMADHEQQGSDAFDALETFDRIQHELGLTKREMFAAADVNKRTYYAWRSTPSTQARVATVRGLWNLADTVEQLEGSVHMPLSTWFQGRGDRRKLLLGRDFDALIDLADGIPAGRTSGAASFERAEILVDVDVPLETGGDRPTRRRARRR